MVKNNETNSFNENSKLTVQVLKLLGGAAFLIIASIGSIALTDYIHTEVIKGAGYTTIGWYILSGFVLAICIILIGISISAMLGANIKNLMNKSAKNLQEANNLFFGNDNKSGVLKVAKDIIELQNKSKNIDEIIISTDSFEKIQGKFFEITNIEDINQLKLYIVGTMIGTFHTNSLNLASHLTKLAETNKGKPFQEASFCSPGHINPINDKDKYNHLKQNFKKDNKYRSLYPFASRFVAGNILLKLWSYYKECDEINLPSNLDEISINLYFVERMDIFPAIQLWSKNAAMILPSTSYIDRNNEKPNKINAINEAMPVALVFRKKYKLEPDGKDCDLSDTLTRLEDSLIKDYNMEDEENSEIWKLNVHTNKCEIVNYVDLFEHSIFLQLIDNHNGKEEQASNTVKNIINELKTSKQKKFDFDEFKIFVDSFYEVITNIHEMKRQS